MLQISSIQTRWALLGLSNTARFFFFDTRAPLGTKTNGGCHFSSSEIIVMGAQMSAAPPTEKRPTGLNRGYLQHLLAFF